MFSGGIKWEHWPEIAYMFMRQSYRSSYKEIELFATKFGFVFYINLSQLVNFCLL